jgi:hypothetical protein
MFLVIRVTNLNNIFILQYHIIEAGRYTEVLCKNYISFYKLSDYPKKLFIYIYHSQIIIKFKLW